MKDQQIPHRTTDLEIAKEINADSKTLLKAAKKINYHAAQQTNQQTQDQNQAQSIEPQFIIQDTTMQVNKLTNNQGLQSAQPNLQNLKQQIQQLQQMSMQFQNEINKMNVEYDQLISANTNIYRVEQTITQKATALNNFYNQIQQQLSQIQNPNYTNQNI